ncbi:hypothetical protein QBC40DRAFT_249456 [Triangularia verruculosa]|uniref:Uncharacterized protein n=1 Tax=Triangularia verruculosa TaxID=2587418 RepID=A0AAN6XV01_9PEZI|nr:hypothetical protein QBC40DRAFT_249456 [Triangularia verruculosa]
MARGSTNGYFSTKTRARKSLSAGVFSPLPEANLPNYPPLIPLPAGTTATTAAAPAATTAATTTATAATDMNQGLVRKKPASEAACATCSGPVTRADDAPNQHNQPVLEKMPKTRCRRLGPQPVEDNPPATTLHSNHTMNSDPGNPDLATLAQMIAQPVAEWMHGQLQGVQHHIELKMAAFLEEYKYMVDKSEELEKRWREQKEQEDWWEKKEEERRAVYKELTSLRGKRMISEIILMALVIVLGLFVG